MNEENYSILRFTWESPYIHKETEQVSYDYHGKLFIKGCEPFHFIGTIVLMKDTTCINENVSISARFYQEIEEAKQNTYLNVLLEEARSNVKVFQKNEG